MSDEDEFFSGQRSLFIRINVHGPGTSVCVLCRSVVDGMPDRSPSLAAHLRWHQALADATRKEDQ